MRFVFLNYNFNPSFRSPEVWLERIRGYTGILETLARNHEVISIEQISYDGEKLHNGVDYRFLEFQNHEIGKTRKINEYAASLNPDIVIVHGMHFPLQVIRLRKRLGKKVKIIIQNHAEQPGRIYTRLLQRRADHGIDAYLFTSIELGELWLKKGIIRRRDKIREVMEASSVFTMMNKREAVKLTGAMGDPVFLWVGRLDENKDPLTVVHGFLEYSRTNTRARMYMIFHEEDLLDAVKTILKQKDSNSISIIGKLPHEELGAWYNAADFIISGSHYEGSGVAVCEGMSCGCIPILTRIPSFKKMTGDGACGLLYDVGNKESLIKKLLSISSMNLPEEREKVIKQFRESLSFEAIANKIQEIACSL